MEFRMPYTEHKECMPQTTIRYPLKIKKTNFYFNAPHLGCIIIESMESTTKILFKIYFVCQLPLYFHKTNWCWWWGPTWRNVMMEPGTVNCATIAPSTQQEFRITSKLNISNLTDTNATYVKNTVLQKMLLNVTFTDVIIKFNNNYNH